MAAKLLVDIPVVNWAYTLVLVESREYSFGTANHNVVTLPSGSASLNHAALVFRDTWEILDKGSETGTYVNGQPVKNRKLVDRDILKIGKCEAVFQCAAGRVGKDEWDHTQSVIAGHQSALAEVVQKATAGTSVAVEDLEETFYSRTAAPASNLSRDTARVPSAFANPLVEKSDCLKSADLVWVAQQLASIMQRVLSEPAPRDVTYRLMLQNLREAISADNGFVMIPNEEKSRWIIRAWIGDSASWTQYEKSHPLPLTVTNKAFESMQIVSNAMDEDEGISSPSVLALHVNGYIAVPLVEGAQRRGVLYFDTRQADKTFTARDVKLLELAGACILEIEDERK